MATKEERVLELVREGRVSIDWKGRIWKHWRMLRDGQKRYYKKLLRADYADKLGYCRGNYMVGKKQLVVYSHRLVWAHHNGTIPTGKELNHKNGIKSDNRIANLELVTRSENLKHAHNVTDSFSKNGVRYSTSTKMTPEKDNLAVVMRNNGETWSDIGKFFDISATGAQNAVKRGLGQTNRRIVLSWEQVREIRRLYAAGGETNESLAKKFGTVACNISCIVRGKTWKERRQKAGTSWNMRYVPMNSEV